MQVILSRKFGTLYVLLWLGIWLPGFVAKAGKLLKIELSCRFSQEHQPNNYGILSSQGSFFRWSQTLGGFLCSFARLFKCSVDSHLAPSGLLGDLGLAWAWRLLTVAAWVRLRTAIPSNAFRATRHVFEKTLRAMSVVTGSEQRDQCCKLSILLRKRGATSHCTSLTNNTG